MPNQASNTKTKAAPPARYIDLLEGFTPEQREVAKYEALRTLRD